MLKEHFLGRNPTHFNVNPLVKAFIISETFVWSSYNFVTPIFAIFVINNIAGGNVQTAASAFSIFLISRVIFDLISCRFVAGQSESKKMFATILGLFILSIGYFGFAFSRTISFLFFFYIISGMGLGIATPSKNSLFSTHLDKNKEPTEWGIYDAITFIGMASTAALGGFIANQYGFQFLFLLACGINLLGIIPYLLYVSPKKNKSS